MTIARAKLITPWLLSIALLAVAIVSLGAVSAVAEDKSIYRYVSHTSKMKSTLVRFKAQNPSSRRARVLAVNLPIKLQSDQTIVDGIFSKRTGLLATMTGQRPSVIQFTMAQGTNRSKTTRIEERPANDQDKELFVALQEGDKSKTERLISFPSARPECKATIYTTDDCGACVRKKAEIYSDPGRYGCNDITWFSCGLTYLSPSQACREKGIFSFPTIHGKLCSDCNSGNTGNPLNPGNPQNPPTNPNPPSNPCPGTYGAGHTLFCGDLSGGYNCCNPQTQNCVRPPGERFGYCENKTTQPKPPTSPEKPDVCSVDPATGEVSCGPATEPGQPDNRPEDPPQPTHTPSPQPTTNPGGNCSITYTCNYPDGSTGRGTVTCSPGQTSHSGSFGTLDCTSCRYSPAPNCSNTTPPPPPQNSGDPTPDPTDCAYRGRC